MISSLTNYIIQHKIQKRKDIAMAHLLNTGLSGIQTKELVSLTSERFHSDERGSLCVTIMNTICS